MLQDTGLAEAGAEPGGLALVWLPLHLSCKVCYFLNYSLIHCVSAKRCKTSRIWTISRLKWLYTKIRWKFYGTLAAGEQTRGLSGLEIKNNLFMLFWTLWDFCLFCLTWRERESCPTAPRHHAGEQWSVRGEEEEEARSENVRFKVYKSWSLFHRSIWRSYCFIVA